MTALQRLLPLATPRPMTASWQLAYSDAQKSSQEDELLVTPDIPYHALHGR